MEILKQRILYNWNVMRIIRLVLGIVVLGQAVADRSVALGGLAAVILFRAITATGCCATDGCRVPSSGYKEHKTDIDDLPAK